MASCASSDDQGAAGRPDDSAGHTPSGKGAETSGRSQCDLASVWKAINRPTGMTSERALQVSEMLADAWYVQNRISRQMLGDFSRVTLAEAICALAYSRALASRPKNAACWTVHRAIDPERVPELWAWAVATSAIERITREVGERFRNRERRT